MKMMKVVTLENLKYYHNLLTEYIDKRIDLADNGYTNCPNCGAIITKKECPYCGTHLVKWYQISTEVNGDGS